MHTFDFAKGAMFVLLSLFALVTSSALEMRAQCVADHNFGPDVTLGIYPDQALGEYLAAAQLGLAYSDTLHLRTPTDTDEMGLGLPFNLTIDSLVITDIQLIPTAGDTVALSDIGLELICNNGGDAPNPCAFLGNSQYCGLLEGTPTQVDTFQVLINVMGYASYLGVQQAQGLAFTNELVVSEVIAGAGCTDPEACNYDSEAVSDDGSCEYPDFCYDCAGECICDEDNDGVCDPWEFYGCTEELACNYSPVYTEDDGSCFYAIPGFDCNGGCLDVVNDTCGFAQTISCGELVEGSTICADTADVPFCDQFNIGEYTHGGLWYSVIGTGDSLLMTLCFEDTDYDTYLNVFDGTCGALDCVAGNDDQSEATAFDSPCGENFLASEVHFLSEVGVEYFIHISGSNAVNPASGGFDFVIVCDNVVVPGCMDVGACNHNPWATIDDGSCEFESCAGCDILSACNYDSTAVIGDFDLCDFSCYGCMDDSACNFNPDATIESGLCEFISCAGCLDPAACNYDSTATIESGLCEFITCVGCTDPAASNYDEGATVDDGNCSYCDLTVDTLLVVHPLCFGGSDGSLEVSVSGATGDSLWFVLSGVSGAVSDTSASFEGLSSGPYEIEIFDGDSTCSALAVASLIDPAQMVLAATTDSTLCADSADGGFTVELVGGAIGDVIFEIVGQENTATTSGDYIDLPGGVYTVLATSLVGCEAMLDVQVLSPDPLEVVVDLLTGADPDEADGAIAVSVTGGTPDFTFLWSQMGETVSDAEDLLAVAAGDYDLTVVDANGCVALWAGTVPLGLPQLAAPQAWRLMPNPARDVVVVDFTGLGSGEVCAVEIWNGLGALIEVAEVSMLSTLDVSRLGAGVYWLRPRWCGGRAGSVATELAPLSVQKLWVLR